MPYDDRLARLERALGKPLPPDYRQFLHGHREDQNRPTMVVGANPDCRDVRTLFELGDGPNTTQLDEIYRLVGDVLPVGTIAIADDIGGNLYLLDYLGRGGVLWWDHEQDLGEDRVERVADSFTGFLADLRPDESD
jgi:hypothetical protein